MTEAQRALDEIEASLDYLRAPTANMPWEAAHLAKVFSLLPTLRAALTPPADDEVAAIRARHEEADAVWYAPERTGWPSAIAGRAHTDRATLLRALDEALAKLERYDDALDEIEAQQQYLRVGGAYVDDTGQLEAGLERAVEIARAALKETP